MHHRVAAKHRLLDRRGAGHVPGHGVRSGNPQRIEGGCDPVPGPDQQPDLVTLPGQRGYRMGADISGPTGDQHPHRQLPTAAGAEHTAVRSGGKPPGTQDLARLQSLSILASCALLFATSIR
jgi:hypothetical protein